MNSNIHIAKVDISIEKDLRKRIQITRFPTLKLIVNEKLVSLNYTSSIFDLFKFYDEHSSDIQHPVVNDVYEEENGILLLNSNNFDKALKEFNNLVVKFCKYFNLLKDYFIYYIPSFNFLQDLPRCGSELIEPEFTDSATYFNSLNVRFAKVDMSIELYLIQKFQIREIPTIKLFKMNTSIDYTGKFDSFSIVNWIQMNHVIIPPTVNAKDVLVLTDSNFDDTIKKYEFLMVYFCSYWNSLLKRKIYLFFFFRHTFRIIFIL